jgi:hypothetical protein
MQKSIIAKSISDIEIEIQKEVSTQFIKDNREFLIEISKRLLRCSNAFTSIRISPYIKN